MINLYHVKVKVGQCRCRLKAQCVECPEVSKTISAFKDQHCKCCICRIKVPSVECLEVSN